ncbi:hypothetical protein [Streptomyces sp. NPDC014656]|uniref:hypothetical protein n=1 Tax=Streptomyces sp. NPDC014656 TaxID=3364878 RepID=UPI0036FE9190
MPRELFDAVLEICLTPLVAYLLRHQHPDTTNAPDTTDTPDMSTAARVPRHCQRTRAEDRNRAARATGLRNLPLHDTAQNQWESVFFDVDKFAPYASSEHDGEWLLYVPGRAYELALDEKWDRSTLYCFESCSHRDGWPEPQG